MKKFLLLFLFLFISPYLLLKFFLYTSPAETLEQYPMVQTIYNIEGIAGNRCLGTFITPYHLVTAAHCVERPGVIFIEQETGYNLAVEVAIHPNYPGMSNIETLNDLKADIAVVKFSLPYEGPLATLSTSGAERFILTKEEFDTVFSIEEVFFSVTYEDTLVYLTKQGITKGNSGGATFNRDTFELVGVHSATSGIIVVDIDVSYYTDWINFVITYSATD